MRADIARDRKLRRTRNRAKGRRRFIIIARASITGTRVKGIVAPPVLLAA